MSRKLWRGSHDPITKGYLRRLYEEIEMEINSGFIRLKTRDEQTGSVELEELGDYEARTALKAFRLQRLQDLILIAIKSDQFAESVAATE